MALQSAGDTLNKQFSQATDCRTQEQKKTAHVGNRRCQPQSSFRFPISELFV